jgi:hypothetical protein
MVGPGRLELPTPRLSSVCSNQLSYGPKTRCRPASAGRKWFGILRQKEKRGTAAPSYRCTPKSAGRINATGPTDPSCSNKTSLLGRDSLSKKSCNFLGIPTGHKPRSLKEDFLRKEVIQPQVPLRLPCYDFTPVADPTVVACLLAVSTAPSGKANSHGVTGGVYKARERIHRGILIHDY